METPPAATFSKLRPLRSHIDPDLLHARECSLGAISGR